MMREQAVDEQRVDDDYDCGGKAGDAQCHFDRHALVYSIGIL